MSAAPVLKEALKFKLEVVKGPMAGQSFEFTKATISIGRGVENDLVLASDPRASRHHAEIRWDGHEFDIYNVSQKNYVIVNGENIEKARLTSNMLVHIGETELKFVCPQLEAPAKIPAQEMLVSIPTQAAAPQVKAQGPLQAVNPQMPAMNAQIPPAMPAAAKPRRRRVPKQPADSGRLRFYAIILIIGAAGYWLLFSDGPKKQELTVRSTDQIEKEMENSREEMKQFETRKEKLDSVQYKRAQENYIRGFRDYKQGNFGRAREAFQVVLNLDPENELAKRYYYLAKVKFDELVKFHMLQGNRYREKKNWRMCKASYFNVMTMVNNGQDPVYREAKQYYDQCSLAQEGRF